MNRKPQKYTLSLNPCDISMFIRNHPSKDLPHMIHYWKLGLYQYHPKETDLYNHLLERGINTSCAGKLVKTRLGSEILKTIYNEKDPLTMILKSHLIFEFFLNEIYEKNELEYKKLSFYSKVYLLKNRSLLKDDISNDLFLLNELRNEYVHNYYFDIGSFDVSKFSICNGLYDGLPLTHKKTKAVLNVKTYEFVLLNILDRLSFDFPYLVKLKNKEAPANNYYDDLADKIGKIMAFLSRESEKSKLGLEININFTRKVGVKISVNKKVDNKN